MLRFAPSPISDMDICDLRVAILNYVVSQQRQEKFLVRIEDADIEKDIEGKDTEIMMILEKFAIKHDSVYHQSEHLRIHQTLALRLLKEEKAFICKCGDEECIQCDGLKKEDYQELKESGEEFVIRLRKPSSNTLSDDVDSFVILKKDGTPSSNFASACDDMLSDISFIIRSEEYLANMPKDEHIKSSLEYEMDTEYLHLPTILNSGEVSIKWLFEEGFIPDAILNYLLLLGNVEAPKEIFTLPEAIEWFNLDTISKSATKFDIDKLRFINREHLYMMDDKQLSSLFGFADADIGKLAKIYLEEVSTTNELKAKIQPIFKPKKLDDELGEEMKIISDIIFDAPAFETFNELQKHITDRSGLKGENLLRPLRFLLTGTHSSPELSKIYPFIKSYILEVASWVH